MRQGRQDSRRAVTRHMRLVDNYVFAGGGRRFLFHTGRTVAGVGVVLGVVRFGIARSGIVRRVVCNLGAFKIVRVIVGRRECDS